MGAENYQQHISQQFSTFLRYVAGAAFGFGALEISFGLLLNEPALVVVGVAVICFSFALVGVQRLESGSDDSTAGGLAALAFLVTPLVFVAAMPALLPIAVFFVIAACSLSMLFSSRRVFWLTTAGGTLTGLALAVIGLLPPFLAQPAPWVTACLWLSNLPTCTALMALLFSFIRGNFTTSLRFTEEANAQLRTLQASLADQVARRTKELEQALCEVQTRAAEQAALLAENQQQRETIRRLGVPALPLGAGTLVMPLVGLLDDERLEALLSRALDAIAAASTRTLIIDITGVPVIDAEVAGGLLRVPQAARLLGAEVVMVGMSPEVAQTVVSLGLNFGGLRTASTLQDALLQR